MKGCLSEHPLAFLQEYSGRVDEATAFMVELTQNLNDSNATLDILNQECGDDMSFLPTTLQQLEKELLLVQSNMNKLVNLASCHSISPLLRRLTHGAICKESAHGLTWIWGSSLFICICCFVMLTTRAALYNPVKKRKPREKKPKRVVEKEFEEYKEFMSEYYDDATEWKLVQKGTKESILEIDFGSQILPNPTFETATTTKVSSEEDDFSEEAEINRSLDQDDSTVVELGPLNADEDNVSLSPSSSGSDYESDSDLSEDGNSDDESALLSFIVETRSILSETKSILSETRSIASNVANRTIKKFRHLRPLLAKTKFGEEDNNDDHSNDDSGLFFDQHNSPAKSLKVPESGDGIWNNFLTPPSHHGLFCIKTPTAPLKPFSFLSRTSEAAAHEMVPLTRTPSRDEVRPDRNHNGVHPRRLTLSPLTDSRSSEKLTLPPKRSKQRTRLNLGVATPERSSQTTRRPRLDSNDSDDISLYVEDAPKPPQKVYRRLPRTFDEKDIRKSNGGGVRKSSRQY